MTVKSLVNQISGKVKVAQNYPCTLQLCLRIFTNSYTPFHFNSTHTKKKLPWKLELKYKNEPVIMKNNTNFVFIIFHFHMSAQVFSNFIPVISRN